MVRNAKKVLWLVVVTAGLAMAEEPKNSPGPEPAPNSQGTVDERLKEAEAQLKRTEERLKELEASKERGRTETFTRVLLPEVVKSFDVYGHVVGGYSWNLDKPDGRRGENALRSSDPDHNTFGVTYAKLGVAREVSGVNELDAGVRLELGVGRLVETMLANDGLFDDGPIDLPQAYAKAQLPTPWGLPVTVKAGRWMFMHGGETLDLPANLSTSLGYLATFGPKTLTGASLELRLGTGLRYEQFVANGWDQVVDENHGKTVGGLLTFELPGLTLRGGWLLGAERQDSSDKRWALNIDATWRPLVGTELGAAVVYGEEEGADVRDGGLARFGGLGLAARQGFFAVDGKDATWHRVALVARGEVFRDRGGSRSGEHQDLAQVTGGMEFYPVEGLALRAEYRHDWSSQNVFGGKDEQETVTLSVALQF